MAYVAKEIEGKFYVGKGKSYYPSTEAQTFEEAEKEAMKWEFQELFNRAEKVYEAGVKKGYFEAHQMGEYLC